MFSRHYHFFLAVVVTISSCQCCEAISNTSFNASIRDYEADKSSNVTDVKTLQKEEKGKNAYFKPATNPIKFKEIPDSALSSSSHSRGLLFHDHQGYTLNDYEDGPHYEYGHDYHLAEHHPDPHGPHSYEHHEYNPHHYGGYHHFDHGHYKHHKHALATKAALWPLAGIALLGAAALVVSNPVLLQLGVVSGKRRRRDTEEITGPDYPIDSFKKYAEKIKNKINIETVNIDNPNKNNNFKGTPITDDSITTANPHDVNIKKRILMTRRVNNAKRVTALKGLHSSIKSTDTQWTKTPERDDNSNDDDKFVPVPIKLRSPKII